jgi:hypothetical protein
MYFYFGFAYTSLNLEDPVGVYEDIEVRPNCSCTDSTFEAAEETMVDTSTVRS